MKGDRSSTRARAPGLSRLVDRAAAEAGPPTRLWIPPGLRSVRGIDGLTELTDLTLPATIGLARVARLPRLTSLTIEGEGREPRALRLQPLARAPALETLMLHNLRWPAEGIASVAAIPSLRVLEISSAPCPDLRGLAGAGLERLVLDSAYSLRPGGLAGLGVAALDLWGAGLADIEVLATMPRLREVWLIGNDVPSLRPLLHLGAGARVFVDGEVDPADHRREIAALEARGVLLMIADDPSEHGVNPSWWQGGPTGLDESERGPIYYQSPGWADS